MTTKTNKQTNGQAAATSASIVATSPQERGAVFRQWLKAKKIRVGDFAEATDIHPSTLARYFKGAKDLATVDQDIAERILGAMNIRDTEAWELLNIPEENRGQFRSFRAPPLGHGPEIMRTAQETLVEPMFGETVLPAGVAIEVEPKNLISGIQILQLHDGRFHAVNPEMAGRIDGRRLGRLVAAYFSAQPA